MSKRTKRLLCLLLVLCMLPVLSGCGLGTALTAAKTARAMSKLESFEGELSAELQADIMGVSTPLELSVPVKCVISPLQFEASLDFELLGLPFSFRFLGEKEDDILTMYLGMDASGLSEQAVMWSASQSAVKGGAKLDVKTVMGAYLALSDCFEEKGTETLAGFECTLYEGVLTRKVVEKFFEGSGGFNSGNVSLTEAELIDALSDTPVSFWLEKAGSRVIGLRADLSDLAALIAEEALKDSLPVSLGVSEAVFSFTFTDFDCVDEIVIPDEARAALEKK